MISLKEYAEKKGVSYEAVRRQVNRYKEELKDHVQQIGRTRYLDEDGENFLDQKRKQNPVVMVSYDKDSQIEELKQENDNLKVQVLQLQDLLIKSKDELLARDQQLLDLQKQLFLLKATVKEKQEKTEKSVNVENAEKQEVQEATVSRAKSNSINTQKQKKKRKKRWKFW
jgi:tetrahydromethanopterin S-methyltransferase subunit F